LRFVPYCVAAIAFLGSIVGADSVANAQRCWTYSDCANKCKRTWEYRGTSAVTRCVATFPCSKFPRGCRR